MEVQHNGQSAKPPLVVVAESISITGPGLAGCYSFGLDNNQEGELSSCQ